MQCSLNQSYCPCIIQISGQNVVSPSTAITYLTTGTLNQILVNEKFNTIFTHIILDEVHSRDLPTDLLLLLLKKMLQIQPNWKIKIILLSATLNVETFKDYFKDMGVGDFILPAKIVIHKINQFYLEDIYRSVSTHTYLFI